MNTSPPETCAWSNLIQGIKRVDPKTVKSDTIAREALPKAGISSLYVSVRPYYCSKKSGISTASLPPSLIGSRRERPWTDFQDPTASLPVHMAAEQRLSTGDMKR